MVTRLNRCARSNLDFYRILEILKTKDVELKVTSQDYLV